MDNPVVQLPLDLTGTNPNNLIGSEEHLLVDLDGFPYKIITLFHGGFYTKGLKVYDKDYNKLRPNVDYICTYKHRLLSDRVGLEVCSAIVFINHALTDEVHVSAQMVGGDLAYSFSVINDYIAFYNATPGHVPDWIDYNGYEPIWGPGELVQERWGLDGYQPMNNELENIARRLLMGPEDAEEELRESVRDRLAEFLALFNDRLQRHINDKANPHDSTAEKVGLGLLRNLPVATDPQALAIASNDHYLVPRQAWLINDQYASIPLKNHVDQNPADPHDLTFTQLNAHSREQANAIIGGKQQKGSTVANALNIVYNGAWTTYDSYVAQLRKNLRSSYFPNGMLQAVKMGTGPLEWNTVFRGDKRWSRVTDIMAEYVTEPGAQLFIIAGVSNDPNATTNWLNAVQPYATIGSMAFARLVASVGQGWGNGEDWYNYNPSYLFYKTAGGWVTV
jgi:hypothetical protein